MSLVLRFLKAEVPTMIAELLPAVVIVNRLVHQVAQPTLDNRITNEIAQVIEFMEEIFLYGYVEGVIVYPPWWLTLHVVCIN